MAANDRRATATYARYIGRVGALAVALGVGGAVATTPGVAWADDSPSATAGPAGASTSSGSEAAPAPAGSDQTQGDTRADEEDTGDADEDDADEDDADEDDAVTDDGEEVEPPEEPVEEPVEEVEPPAEPVEEPHVPPVPEEPGPVEAVTPAPETGDVSDAVVPTEPATGTTDGDVPAPEPDSMAVVDTSASVAADLAAVQTVSASSRADDPALAAAARTQLVGLPPLRLNLPTPEQFIASIPAPVVTCLCGVVKTVTTFYDTVLKPLLGGVTGGAAGPAGPAAPAQSPALWALAAWVRRQATQAVDSFIASPLGTPVRMLITAVDDFGDSPQGRALGAAVIQLLGQCGPSADLPAELDRTVIVSGLTEPTDFTILTKHHSDEVDRIFITEKGGSVKVYDPTTGAVTTLTVLSTTTGGERGLTGIEVHPDFWHEGEFGYRSIYVAYTSGLTNHDTLSRLVLSEDMTRVESTQILLESTEDAKDFHHGGDLAFDADGTHLYWVVGDNTQGVVNSQSLANIHGKVLRLNPDGSVPDDNPFVDADATTASPADYIYALGFRNPFRLNFTPTGQLLVADVGEATWEELNLVVKGGNYGWPSAEGNCTGCASVNPIYAYRHTAPPANAGAITSVVVYNGTTFPDDYRNTVFIADYSQGWIRVLEFDEQYSSLISSKTFWGNAGATVNLAQGPDDNLYQLTIYPGELAMISPSGGNRAPTAILDASQTTTADKTLTVDFSGVKSHDPDGDNLTYRWDFGDGNTSTGAVTSHTFSTAGAYSTYTVTLTVSDGEKTNTTTQKITVGSTPPVAEIVSLPSSYNAGDTITFSGRGTDAQDRPDGGTLPDSAYRWTVVFHHNEHTHPFADNIVGPTGTITIPRSRDQIDGTWYRVHLTVTDSSGLSTTTYRDINPNLVDLTVSASDPGAKFTIDGLPYTGSYTERAVVGVDYVLSAPTTQVVDGKQLTFDRWSDGGAPTHAIRVPATPTTYTVVYTADSRANLQQAV
ncbi:PQQ-dependent sugar dehydrogenase [Mycolicibacterium litorale]|uniref:PQQ-dependent sugar dehydrogenase n=1 Tax=Mycolicibacterium litorale TaxID=758802 RepID=UPI0039A2697C